MAWAVARALDRQFTIYATATLGRSMHCNTIRRVISTRIFIERSSIHASAMSET